MIIARIESLIFNKPVNDALKRAEKYLEGGADGIMIHSKDKNPDKIFKFIKIFRKKFTDVNLVVVPSSFNHVKRKKFYRFRCKYCNLCQSFIKSLISSYEKYRFKHT